MGGACSRDSDSRIFLLRALPPAAAKLAAKNSCEALQAVRSPEELILLLLLADKLQANVPHAKRVGISDIGHMPNMEKPEEFNSIVLDFLSKS